MNATPRVEEHDSKSNSAQISEVGSPSPSSSVSDASSAEKGRDTNRLRTRTEHERNEDKEFALLRRQTILPIRSSEFSRGGIVYPNDGGEPEYEYKVHWFGTRASEDEWFLRSSLVIDYSALVEDFDRNEERGTEKMHVNSEKAPVLSRTSSAEDLEPGPRAEA